MTFCADWKGNKCWECWKLEPCCGEPCNFGDGAMCCLCWTFCSPCSLGALFAHSVKQECACVNHCLINGCLLSCCSIICLRNNLRREVGVGQKDSPDLIGDILCGLCCGYCSACQILRTVDRSTWDWMAKMGNMGMWVPPLVFMYDGPSGGGAKKDDENKE